MDARLELTRTSGPLPTSDYGFLVDGRLVGRLQLRHRPSHSPGLPPDMASHVYYEIDEAYRGRGWGRELLRLGLAEAWLLGLHEIIATCREGNVASRRVIEANGGTLEGHASLRDGGRMLKFRLRKPLG